MTSPHAASEEVIASTATTVLDDSPPNVYLTAADNAAIDANMAAKSSSDVQTTKETADQAGTPIKDELGTMEQLHISQKTTPPPIANATVELPRTPPAQIKHEITVNEPAIPETPELEDGDQEFPRIAMAEQQQLDTMANLMSYRGAPGSAEMLNGQVMNPASMADLAAQDMQYNHEMMGLPPYEDHQSHLPPNDETRISAYALLEFEDGQFYMNTYQVILGRDLAAAKAAIKRDAELEREKQRQQEVEAGGEAQTPARVKREGSKSRHAKSVISESAGILREGNDSDSDDRARRRKKASKKTKSTGSTSQKISRRPSLVQPIEKIDYQPQPPARRQAPETIGAVPVDPGSLRPSPHDCPIIGIHPPATTPASGYKAISRQHVKIAYNSKKSLFEAEIIGRNGAFIDDQFYYHQDIIPLKSGSCLQIGGVVVRFVLPDVAIGETGAENVLEQEGAAPERYVEGDKEMSFDFERPADEAALRDSSDDESNEADIPRPGIEHDDDEFDQQQAQYEEEQQVQQAFDDDDDDELSSLSDVPDEDEDQQESSEVKDEQEEQVQQQQHQQDQHQPQYQPQQQQHPQYVQQSIEQHQQEQPQQPRTGLPSGPEFMLPMPKKRGPGRPPKNGIMSKREQQLAKKEAQQRALEEQMQQQPDMGMRMSISGKNKVGRPRKNPLMDDQSPVKTEKRKYTKRKPKEETLGFPHPGSGSGDDNEFPKQYKEKKSTKPPRSPSPTFNEADLTPEQLAKPQANYVTLIHEALSNSPTGQMSLPQIYRAIQRRYPFFVLKCNTNGWQSSVRHNLSQHHAFRKVERDGKGWMWAIVDGVSIEKEKKRRPTPPHQLPPHMQQQPLYRAGPPPYPMYGPPGSMPPPGYMHPGMPPHMRPPGPPYMGQPMPYGMPPGPPPPHMNGHPPPGYPPMPMAPQLAPQTGGYSSPYAPKPPQGPPPPQQQQPQAPMGMQPQHGPPPPQQPYQQQQPRPIQQAPPPQQPDAHAQRTKVIENFRSALVNSLKTKTNKAEAIVQSAINRVNGVSSQSTAATDPKEHQIENQILDALKKLLVNFPLPSPQQQPQYPQQPPQGGPPQKQPYGQPPMQQQPGQPPVHQSPYGQPPPQQMHQMQPPPPQNQKQPPQQPVQSPYQQQAPVQQQPQQAPAPQQGDPKRQPLATISPQSAPAQQANAEGTAKPSVTTPTVQRPSFSGQAQNRAPFARPPMTTPGMSRTTSGSGTPANAARNSTSASPHTSAATPVSAPNQTAAQAITNGVPANGSPLPAPAVAQAAPPVQQQPPQPIAAPTTQQPAPQPAPAQLSVAHIQQTVEAAQQSAPAPVQQPTPQAQAQQTVVQAPAPAQGIPLPPPPMEKLTPVPSAANTPQQGSPVNENGKRPLEDGMTGNENQEFKRINSGPTALKA